MTISDILKKFHLSYEDLNAAEKETLNNWLNKLNKTEIKPEDVKNYIREMISGVETELTEADYHSKKDIFLKARLKNYLLLEAFLESPEKARKALEKQLANLKQ